MFIRFKTMSNPINAVGSVNEKKASFEWVICNFSEIFDKSQNTESIESPILEVLVHHQITKWKLKLYPKGDGKRNSKFTSLYLKCLSDVNAYIDASFAIINSQNEAVDRLNLSYYLYEEESCFGSFQFIEHSYLFENKEDLLPGDNLTVRCKLVLDKSEEYYEKIEKGVVEDFDDFGMLFNNEKLNDVTISVRGQKHKLYAHQHVLAQKSEVFANMFGHDMLEKKNKSVNIKDVPYEAMESMLRYIYVGDTYDVSDSVYLDLIKAADKYQIEGLKTLCADKVLSQLTVENSFNLLTVADQSNAITLKAQIIDFIVENSQTMIESPDFKAKADLHTQLWCELFCEFVRKKK